MKIYSRTEDFQVQGTEIGVMLLKTILVESGMQTSATILKLKDKLANLPIIMGKLAHNIEKFNSHVLGIIISLKRKGATAPDLLLQLFPAYLSCPDKQFGSYIGEKRDRYEEGGGNHPCTTYARGPL